MDIDYSYVEILTGSFEAKSIEWMIDTMWVSQFFPSDAVDALVEKYRYSGMNEQLDVGYEANPDLSRLDRDIEVL